MCLVKLLWCWPISLKDARGHHACGHLFKANARETVLDLALCVSVCWHEAIPDLVEAESSAQLPPLAFPSSSLYWVTPDDRLCVKSKWLSGPSCCGTDRLCGDVIGQVIPGSIPQEEQIAQTWSLEKESKKLPTEVPLLKCARGLDTPDRKYLTEGMA